MIAMQYNMKTILWIFIISSLTENGLAEPLLQFNCRFVPNNDNKYYEPFDNEGYPNIYNSEPTAYGVRNVVPAANTISRAIATVLRTYPVDTITDFFHFYDAFKNITNFDEFHQRYLDHVPPFYPYTGSYGLVLLVLELLLQSGIPISSLYIVTVHLNMNAACLRNIMRNNEDTPPECFIHGQTAAVLKIDHNGRLGYFLMDPIFGVGTPLMIYEDSYEPVKAPSVPKFEYRIVYNTSASYIMATNTATNPPQRHVYFVKRPFCGFAQKTTKRELLDPFRVMLRRNELGQPTASLGWTLVNRINEPHEFNVVKYDFSSRSVQPVQSTSFNFDQISYHMTQMEDYVLNQFIQYFGYLTQANMIQQLEYTGKIFRNEGFIENYRRLRGLYPAHNNNHLERNIE